MLDAPELQDDFYLNLVDWSAGNLLSVGLGACVYLWSACTSQVSSTPSCTTYTKDSPPLGYKDRHDGNVSVLMFDKP